MSEKTIDEIIDEIDKLKAELDKKQEQENIEDTAEVNNNKNEEDIIKKDIKEDNIEETKEENKENKDEISEGKNKDENAEESKADNNSEEKSDALKSDDFEIPYIDSSVYKHKKKKKIFKICLIAFLCVLLMVYFGGVIYHASHFGTDTYINQYNVSGMTFEEATDILNDEIAQYELEIIYKNGSHKVKKGDGGLDVVLAQSVKSLKANRNPFMWPKDIFTEDKYTMDFNVNFDQIKMKEYINSSEYMDVLKMEPSTNARVDMKNGEVVVIKDVTGTELDANKVYAVVTEALLDYKKQVNIDENDCYIRAEITAESQWIENAVKNAEEFLNIKGIYDFNGHTVQIPKEELSIMGYVDEKGQIKISKNNVYAYANKFANKYTTSYTERRFITHDKKEILVYGGYYGWILDGEKEAEELYELMLKKEHFYKEPVCEKEGYAFSDLNDIGDSYVEVDLDDQEVYLYIDGKLILKTDCVTGDMPYYKTPGGLYGVTYRAYNVVLRGPDYESPVTFWMPFNGDIGLHDATWRAAFGDDIYTYDGSHGCVNLPYSAAGEIFDYLEEDFPVVCYWDDEVEYVND